MDADADGDVGYSSDWDSDEDEDKSEEDDDLLFDAHAQTLNPFGDINNPNAADDNNNHDNNGNGNIGWSPGAQAFGPPTLPPLASVPVYALECVPEQTGRNGVPFMGRGTPVDRTRRAEWASPLLPLARAAAVVLGVGCSAWMRHSRPAQAFYTPPQQEGDMTVAVFPEIEMGMEMGMSMSMEMGFDAMQIDVQPQVQQQFGQHQHQHQQQEGYVQQHECMPWLDPALRAASSSSSPEPEPAPYAVPVPCTPSPQHQQHQQDFVMGNSEYSSTPDLSSSLSSSSSGSGSSSPTGCAWHATFLQCLQSPTGCAPCFPSPSPPTPTPASAAAYVEPSSPTPAPASQHCAAPTQVFIQPSQGLTSEVFAMVNQEYVRPHAHLPVVSGSVSLSHALG